MVLVHVGKDVIAILASLVKTINAAVEVLLLCCKTCAFSSSSRCHHVPLLYVLQGLRISSRS